jgi:hypothetical protein
VMPLVQQDEKYRTENKSQDAPGTQGKNSGQGRAQCISQEAMAPAKAMASILSAITWVGTHSPAPHKAILLLSTPAKQAVTCRPICDCTPNESLAKRAAGRQ